MNKKIKLIMFLTILSVLLLGTLLFFFTRNYSKKTTGQETRYIVAMANNSDIDVTIKTTGIVFAANQKEISAKNNGEIRNLTVNEGDTVKKGQTLFTVYSDQIKQQMKSAEINLEKQKLQLEKAKDENEIKLQNLLLEEAENNLNNIKKQYNEMTVKSPINGLVVAKNGNNGDTVQSAKSILTIIDTSSLKIKASIDELDISKVKIGQNVKIKFNAIEDKIYEGKIESISQIGNNQNNVTTYDIVISLNDTKDIRINMTANVEIQVQSKSNALVIPIEALIERGDRKFVYVPSDSSSSESKAFTNSRQVSAVNEGRLIEIKTGIKNDTYIEVLDGLEAGQKILIRIASSSNNSFVNRQMQGMGFFQGAGPNIPGGQRRSSSTNGK